MRINTNNDVEAPLVTVTLMTYNQEKYVKGAIESILAQTYDNIELIVLDDCSDDNTVECIKSMEVKQRIWSKDIL